MSRIRRVHVNSALIAAASFMPFEVTGFWWFLLLPAAAILGILFYASAFVDSQFYVESHCSGDGRERKIALTFDDGPFGGNTRLMLRLLDEYKVKASFFCIGKRIEAAKDILREIDAKGHVVGNHTYCHAPYFNFLSREETVKDLRRNEELITATIGRRPLLFRPPNGITNPTTAKAVRELGYQVVGWNVRPFDTLFKDRRRVLRRLKQGLRPGSVVLLHDINGDIEGILREFLDHVIENKYTVVPLEELIGVKAYA